MSAHLVIALMVVAALCHALWNLLAKSTAADRTLLVASLSAVMALVALPWAALHPPEHWWPFVGIVVVRALLQCIYTVGLGRGYDALDFSLAYPIARGTGPVVATTLSVILLAERPGAVGLAGVALVSVGILTLALSDLSGRGARSLRRGWGWPAMTGVVIGLYTLVDKLGVSSADVLTYLAWSEGLTASIVAATVLVRGEGRRLESLVVCHWRRIIVCGALAAGGYGFALFALAHAYVSYIAPLRAMSVLFGVVLSGLILREPGAARRLPSAVGIVAGVVLVALAL